MTSGSPTLGGLRRLQNPTFKNITVTGDVTIDGTLTAGSIGSGGDIVLGNGESIKTDTTTAHTASLQAYDVNGTAYKDFLILTNGDTPSMAIAAPSGGVVTIDGSTIGGTTPAAITGTTVASSGAMTAGTGLTATTGNIVATAGNISATLGSVAAATTVTGGTGVTATTGNVTASAGAVVASTYVRGSVANALTATGTDRATGLQLAAQVNVVTTTAAGTGVVLPAGATGMRVRVYNNGAETLAVYALASETINGTAGATGVTQATTKVQDYDFVAANTWVAVALN